MKPGDRVTVPGADVAGIFTQQASHGSTWWNDGRGEHFGIVAIEDEATGEIRYFRGDVVKPAD